jgi:hypothetical protein
MYYICGLCWQLERIKQGSRIKIIVFADWGIFFLKIFRSSNFEIRNYLARSFEV